MGAQIADFYRGDTKNYKFTITADGVTVDCSTDTFWCTMKVNSTDLDEDAIIQVERDCSIANGDDTANGVVIVTIPAVDTATLTPGEKYYIDFQRVTSTGEVTTILVDRVKILQDITITTTPTP